MVRDGRVCTSGCEGDLASGLGSPVWSPREALTLVSTLSSSSKTRTSTK